MAHKPTDEQQAAIDGFATGDNMVIEAAAGTGKTSTLRYIADVDPSKRGLYLAFNKGIQLEASRKFTGTNVKTSTAHALAFGQFGRPMQQRLNARKLSATEFSEAIGVRASYLAREPHSQVGTTVQRRTVIRVIKETVARFARSADFEVSTDHVVVPPQLTLSEGEEQDFREYVVGYARKYWRDVCDPHGRLDFTHDFYMKQWALSNPVIDADYILYDEAQDADALVTSVMAAQTHAQIVAVGDRSQAIYGWRGAVDSMDAFGGDRFQLTQSFRFGHDIAMEANVWLDLLDASLRVRGSDKPSSVGVSLNRIPEAVLCRTNAGAIAEVMFSQSLGVPVGIAGEGRAKKMKALAEAAQSLQTRGYTMHQDLDMFTSWAEVQAYVEEEEGSELTPFVKVIDSYGPGKIIRAIDRCVPEEDARTVIATAHAAKGLEWKHVRISDDFYVPGTDDNGQPEVVEHTEAMLAYVAVTRAIRHLDNSGLSWVRQYQRSLRRPEIGTGWRRRYFEEQKALRETRSRVSIAA